jgi:Trypsin-co-occurring domain 1
MHSLCTQAGERGIMGRSEIVEVEMPDGMVINVEVVVSDSITDVAAGRRLKLDEAKDSIASFVRWAVSSAGIQAESDTSVPAQEGAPLPGMSLSKVGLEFGLSLVVKSGTVTSAVVSAGGQASAVVRLEWERPAAGK